MSTTTQTSTGAYLIDTAVQQVAQTIRNQISVGVLMALGAHKLHYTTVDGDPALAFNVKVLPFNKQGKRLHTPRIMRLTIQLTAWDDYTITVSYDKQGETIVHDRFEVVYFDDLNRVLLSIDSMNDRN